MIVMKFGGTSNQDAAAMTNVVAVIKTHLPEHPVAVISAIARATNELEQTARLAVAGQTDEAVGLVTRLFERHYTIIDNLITDRTEAKEIERIFYVHLAEIKQLIQGVGILRELTARTMDAICSYGERLSSRIIASALRQDGVDAVWLDAKEFMITDDNFGRARPIMEKVTERLASVVSPLVATDKVPVTQGFIGTTLSGAYTTMGRESSDYSASIIGAALDARKVQIWTDVDGILTADPRVVKHVRLNERMSFEEAFELSYFGAKVLHPATMLPVLEKNIPVEIRNSMRSGVSGTTVEKTSGGRGNDRHVKSIAFRKGLTVVTVAPHKRSDQYLFWEGIYSVLSRNGLSVGITSTSEFQLAFTVESSVDHRALSQQLLEFGKVELFPGKASICLVGEGVRGSERLVSRVLSCLDDMHIAMVSFGASPLNMMLVVDETEVTTALERLHREFFEVR